jgi:large subunit ribosomal protein L30
MAKSKKMIKITLVRSPIGNTERHKATIRALGLRKIGSFVEKPDTLAVRGMLSKVNHLVEIETLEK